MDLVKFDKEFDDDFEPIGLRSKRKNLRVLDQVGKSDKVIDESRKALVPGKRVSKKGNIYWETRKNRSDQKGTSI